MSAERFLDVLTTVALQAGAVARRMRPGIRNEPKAGRTPEAQALTPADLASQDILLLALRAAFPEAAVDAEEEAPHLLDQFPDEGPGRPLVVLDPIDGTLNYVNGSQDYAIMAAWCEAGKYEASVVAFPELGRMYLARAGEGAFEWKDGTRIRAELSEPPRVVTVTRGIPAEVCRRLNQSGYEVVRTRCSAVDGVAPLLGRACAALCVGRPGRRRSAGYLITYEAGGIVHVSGEDWQRRDPREMAQRTGYTLLAADESTAAAVMECLD